MFGFEEPEDGSESRYRLRLRRWANKRFGCVYHYFWWLVHNLISHPLIGLFPVRSFFKFHDWTSHRMHRRRRRRRRAYI